jgi:hypothetical protein
LFYAEIAASDACDQRLRLPRMRSKNKALFFCFAWRCVNRVKQWFVIVLPDMK